MDIELSCAICGKKEAYNAYPSEKHDEPVPLCEIHHTSMLYHKLQYNERVILKEYMEANFGEVV